MDTVLHTDEVIMDENRCTDCDGILLSQEGQCEYGYGVYMECRNCGQIFDFTPANEIYVPVTDVDDRRMQFQLGDLGEDDEQ